MIPSTRPLKIKHYFLIDHNSEGIGATYPREGEEIWGIPYAWHTSNSSPYIEHRIDGKCVLTVNALDVSIIVFED